MTPSTNLKLDGVLPRARAVLRRVGAALVAVLAATGGVDVSTRLAAQRSAHASGLAMAIDGGGALLVGFGLLLCAAATARLLGYRRQPRPDGRVQKLESLAEAALRDNLTRLGNHRAFQEDIRRETDRRNRSGSCFSVVMLDLDRLKQTNDTQGHLAGDERIRAVADSLRATLREGDSAYRTGGDEFMVLLPDSRASGAMTFAQRMQADLEKRYSGPGVTCGIAESIGLESRDTILRRADLALYAAKESHRRVVIYSIGLDPDPGKPKPALETRHQHRVLATALARAVESKDSGTRNHCETVSELCALIGQRLGFDPDRIEELRLAGLLHDVGKVGVSDAVLQKQEELGEQEVGEMRGHVAIGHAIVSAAELAEPADWILHHHERVDGAGYPHGLRDEEIPLESRIIGVADAFEAMTADRPYRAGCSTEEALAELARHSGKQFDPRCLAALEQTVALIAPRTSQLETQTGAGGRAPRLLAAPGEAGRGPVEAAIAALPERAA